MLIPAQDADSGRSQNQVPPGVGREAQPTGSKYPQEVAVGHQQRPFKGSRVRFLVHGRAAAGLHRYIKECEGMEQGMEAAAKVLQEVSGLDAQSALTQLILPMYQMILDGAAPAELRRAADALKHTSIGEVV